MTASLASSRSAATPTRCPSRRGSPASSATSTISYASKETILVSLADKLDNARAILRDYRTDGPALWDRFSQNDPKEHLWYYRSLLNVYQRADDTWLVAELERVLDELEELINAAEA